MDIPVDKVDNEKSLMLLNKVTCQSTIDIFLQSSPKSPWQTFEDRSPLSGQPRRDDLAVG